MDQRLFFELAAVLVLGTAAQWIAWRVRVPSILLLLSLGFLAGPVFHLIDPRGLLGDLLLPFVSLSVALILFEGGLSLRVAELKGGGGAMWSLVTIGALATWGLGSWAAWRVLGFPADLSLLLGAILVVTGPTVIQPLLRHIRPAGRLGAIAKWEGIVIDPIGAVLSVLVFDALSAIHSTGLEAAAREAGRELLLTLGAGTATGGCAALVMIVVLRRYWVPDFLHNPVVLGVVVFAFAGSNALRHESGLIAVTVMGIVLANQRAVPVQHLIEFKENLRVLLIAALFILLAANVDAGEMLRVAPRGILFVAALVLVVRPVSVFLATVGLGLTWKERALLAWLAPRGIVAAAVASVFALRLGEAGRGLVPVTFLVIVGTVAVYGLTAPALARRLGLSNQDPQGVVFASAHAGARAIAHAVRRAGFPVLMIDNNRANANAARMEGLPTLFASVLSGHALDEASQPGLGRLLSLTPDDEVNALACLHFREVFGRAEVYQLPPRQEGRRRAESAPAHLRGRLLFGSGLSYDVIDERFAGGSIVKTTRLSKEFDYAAFRERYGERALPLFVVTESARLQVRTADSGTDPKPGQALVALVDEPAGTLDASPVPES